MRRFLQNSRPLFILLLVIVVINLIAISIPREAIETLIRTGGIFTPLIFIILVWLTYIFAPISGTPVMAIGYFLFGADVIIYNFFAIMGAAVTNFWIARKWGVNVVVKLVGKDSFKRFESFTTEHGLIKLLMARFFLLGFHDFISYAYGLTKINFWSYFFVTLIGIIPAKIAVYYLTKYQIDNINQFTFLLLISGVAFIGAFYLWDKYFHKEKH